MNSETTDKGVILVVDDTPTNLEVLFDLLGNSGFKVLIAEDGESALQKANYALPDLILLDILMPGMDGFETCRRLKATESTKSIPVIFLSALTDTVDKVQGFNLGAVDYITKPLQAEEVLMRVETHSRLQALTKQLREQIEQERLIGEIAQGIRRSLNLSEILQTTVDRVRQFLQTERVVIFRFEPNWEGRVVVESVDSAWMSLLSKAIYDPCFIQHYIQPFEQGQIRARADVDSAGLSPCHIELLAQLQIRANLVVPILQGNHLWGLLIAHHCSAPRHWQPLEITLLSSLATQLGIAIQQSELYEQTQLELIERKRAEQKIREQAALLDVATDAILVRDLNHQILFWNQGAERIYGWQATETLGKKATELLYEDIPFQLQEALHTVVETGDWQGELHQITRSNQEIIVQSRWTLVRDEARQPKSILTVNTDITEKKQLEAQFLRTQRLESIGTLASGIAHDLNNILTPILAAAQLLPLKFPNTDERTRQLFNILEINSKRGADLSKQVLSFARGVEGRRTPLQIRHLISEVEQIAKRTFPKSIEVQVDILQSNLWLVFADATQMHQVLMNLFINARDAMPDGGTLTLSATNFLVDETYARMHPDAKAGSYMMMTITDTGIGIPPQILERIFDPFFTTKEVGKGTGLGLSTVIGIIKSHGGFVDVYSEVGKGTCFKVYVPTVEGAVLQPSVNPDPLLGHGELILVVDDEVAIREITKVSLEEYHYRVLTASDGLEAIALYAQHQQEIHVVLMDLMMPNMDGLTAICTLQKMNPQVQIIATSGLASNDKLVEVANIGAKIFLTKPYTTQELLSSLHTIFCYR